MKPLININHRFSIPNMGKICPMVTSFHSYPKYSRMMSNKITAPGWAIEYHSKNAGRIYLKSLSNSIERERQTVHLYAPGSVYWEDTQDADFPIQETYLYFTGAEVCSLNSIIAPDFRFARFYDPDNIVGNLFMTAATCCSKQDGEFFWIVQSQLMKIIYHLRGSKHLEGFNYNIAATETTPSSSSFSYKVEEYLRRNTSRNVTLSEIAAYMKTSESLLCHKFKDETGKSPVARHAELRMEFAKSLILKGEKFKSVAEMTGYGDEYHFSKAFKISAGIPPRAFKQLNITL
ncbi:MAG: AraC family transcriptional regulator [Lentisphaerota bacterium]